MMTSKERTEMEAQAEKHAEKRKYYCDECDDTTKSDYITGYENAMETRMDISDDIQILRAGLRRSRVAELEAALENLLDATMTVDNATVPKNGIESNPTQVVINWHCSYARIKQAREVLKSRPSENTMVGKKEALKEIEELKAHKVRLEKLFKECSRSDLKKDIACDECNIKLSEAQSRVALLEGVLEKNKKIFQKHNENAANSNLKWIEIVNDCRSSSVDAIREIEAIISSNPSEALAAIKNAIEVMKGQHERDLGFTRSETTLFSDAITSLKKIFGVK